MATSLLSADDEGVMAEINMTPLVDVMLVLLIIFMITMPVLAQKIQVTLPQASAAQSIQEKKPITITLTAQGQLLWQQRPVTHAQLAQALNAAVQQDNAVPVHLGADQAVPYGEVMTVMDLVRASGATALGFVTQPAQ